MSTKKLILITIALFAIALVATITLVRSAQDSVLYNLSYIVGIFSWIIFCFLGACLVGQITVHFHDTPIPWLTKKVKITINVVLLIISILALIGAKLATPASDAQGTIFIIFLFGAPISILNLIFLNITTVD